MASRPDDDPPLSDAEFLDAWRRRTREVSDAATPSAGTGAGPWGTAVGRRAKAAPGARTWTPTLAAANARMAFWRPTTDLPVPRATLEAATVRLGFALAARDPTALTAPEADFLKARGFRLPWYAAPPAARPPASGEEFVASVRVPFLDGKARGVAEAPVTVTRVSRDRAEVAWRLGRPDGGTLDVLSYDDLLWRPLLRPGSWEPLDESGFVAAVGGGTPFRDNPYLPPWAGTVPAIADLGAPAAGREAERAASASVGRAGRVESFDGIVHVVTGAPRLQVVMDRRVAREEHGLRIQWRLGSLRSTDVQEVVLAHDGYLEAETWTLGHPALDFPAEDHGVLLQAAKNASMIAGVRLNEDCAVEGPRSPAGAALARLVAALECAGQTRVLDREREAVAVALRASAIREADAPSAADLARVADELGSYRPSYVPHASVERRSWYGYVGGLLRGVASEALPAAVSLEEFEAEVDALSP